MAMKLGISEKIFTETYTRARGRGKGKFLELKEVRREEGVYDCVFLDRAAVPGKALCKLYEARPSQCRYYYFVS